MVRVAAPVMSLEASGSLGGAIVFSTWKGRPYVRSLVTPHNPKSGKQTSMRAMIKFLAQRWDGFHVAATPSWQDLADSQKISPFNVYIQYNQRRWRDFLSPSKYYPADLGSTPSAAGVITATAGIRSVSLSIADGAPAPDWGWLVFRALGAAVTPGIDTLIAIAERTATPTIYVDTPLAAGTWHYKVIGFNDDGIKGAASADANAVVA